MKLFLPAILLLLAVTTQAQVTLTTSPYTENFDNIGTAGVPAGFYIKFSSTATSLGTDSSFQTKPMRWKETARGFKNFASATAVSDPGADSLTQVTATNRALGVRQASTAGWDPGAAFVFQVANTSDKFNFKLDFKLQSLDTSSPRRTKWVVDYGFGATPTTFTTIVTNFDSLPTGERIFSNKSVTVDFGSALDNNAGPVWIRVWASVASTGSGNRATTGIDDWSLSWTTTAPVRDIIRDNNYVKLTGTINSGLNVTFNKAITSNLKMQLTSMNGQVIWQKQLGRAIQGQVESVVPNATVPKGIYMLSISSKEGTFTKQIAVQ